MNTIAESKPVDRPTNAVTAPMRGNVLSSLVEGPSDGALPAVFYRLDAAWESSRGSFRREVRSLAAALAAYGLGPDTRAAVLGSEGLETLRAGLAVIASGATLVPLDPAISDDAMRKVLASTAAVHAIASDERQLARLLVLRPELPALELVLLSSAAPSERKPAALLVDAAMSVGAAALLEDPAMLRNALDSVEGGSACLLIDAAGQVTPVSRAALLARSEAFAKSLALAPGVTLLASLPVGSVERLAVALSALSRDVTLLLADPSARPDSGLDQRPADIIVLDSARLQRLQRAWLEDIEAMSFLKRRATRWAQRQQPGTGWKHGLADRLALRGLREKLGGKAVGFNVVGPPKGGAPAEVDMFFASAGLAVRYGAEDSAVSLAR